MRQEESTNPAEVRAEAKIQRRDGKKHERKIRFDKRVYEEKEQKLVNQNG